MAIAALMGTVVLWAFGALAVLLLGFVVTQANGAQRWSRVLGTLTAVVGLALFAFTIAMNSGGDTRDEKPLRPYRVAVLKVQPTVNDTLVPRMDARIDEALAALARHDGAAAWQALDTCAREWDDGPAGSVLQALRPESASDSYDVTTGKRSLPFPQTEGHGIDAIHVDRLGLCRVTRAPYSPAWKPIFTLIRRHQAKGFLRNMYPLTSDTHPQAKLNAPEVAQLLRELQDWELLDRLSAKQEVEVLGHLLRSYQDGPPVPAEAARELEWVAARIEKSWPAGESRAPLQSELARPGQGTVDLHCNPCDAARLQELYQFGAAYEAVMLQLVRDAPLDDWQRLAARQLQYGVVRWAGEKIMDGRDGDHRFDCHQPRFQQRLAAVLNTRVWPPHGESAAGRAEEDERSSTASYTDRPPEPDRATQRQHLIEAVCSKDEQRAGRVH